MSSRNHGFTLLEVLSVTAIIAILGGLTLVSLGKAQEAGDRATGISGMRSIGLALHHYASDNEGYLPGPLKSGQGVSYIPNKKDSLASVLGVYLGVADNEQQIVVESFMPPAYVKAMGGVAPAEAGNPFVVNVSASNNADKLWPWGSEGQNARPPMKIQAVPGRVWAFCDADQLNPHVQGQPWASKTPEKIVHGLERLALYFDGSVSPISQATLNSSAPPPKPPPPPPPPPRT